MAETVSADGGLLEPGVSVVVPVYNGVATIEELTKRVQAVLDDRGVRSEIILVDDGSRDASWGTISALASSNDRVRGLKMMRNYGQHNAVLAGVRVAHYDTIVTLDDDLQNPPEEIPLLLDQLGTDPAVVYGYPEQAKWGFWRNVASRITKLALQSAMGAATARQVGSFRAFSTRLRDAFGGYHGPFISLDVLLTWGTDRFSSVHVRHDERKAGTSNYTFRKLADHALNMMTGFSVRPLQLASFLGFAFGFLGLMLLVFSVIRFVFSSSSVPGLTFLASVIAIFSGAQLFALGILGEYLARMHFRLMQKPSFVVLIDTDH